MLKQQIQFDSKEALKKGDQFLLSCLRLVLASIFVKEKDKRYKEKLTKDAELSDEELVDVLMSEIKKRKDAIVLYEQGKRPELAEKERKEIEIIQKYLPEQISTEELRKLIEESVTKTGAQEPRDMGRVMADLAPKTKGRADNSEVSKIVKELLIK